MQVGSVIGKAGQIVKNIREETHSKIRVCEGTLQCEDRVIVIAAREDEADVEENNAQVRSTQLEDMSPAEQSWTYSLQRLANFDRNSIR